MNICFRVDASVELGSGHVMRCLTLAQRLRLRGADCMFICREILGNMNDYLKSQGYPVFPLRDRFWESGHLGKVLTPETDAALCKAIVEGAAIDFDWMIVDHYGLARSWEAKIRSLVKQIMVIDDLADREHDCDVLLDQNYTQNQLHRYDGRVPDICRKLLGPQYVLLRPEFKEQRRNLQQRQGTVKQIVVFFGGSDPTNETFKALTAIQMLNLTEIQIEVIVGKSNPNYALIETACRSQSNLHFFCQVEDMARRMRSADLALGAGGTTTWERCYLGLPALTVVIAKNQMESTVAVADFGALWNLGWYKKVSVARFAQAMRHLIENPAFLQSMSQNALALVGEVERGEREILGILMGESNGQVN